MSRRIIIITTGLLFALFIGCAYYNTFYNAKKAYKTAEKERRKRMRSQVVELSPEEKDQLKRSGRIPSRMGDKPTPQEMQNYQVAIEKASKVLEYYSESKWVDDALMLLGKCFYFRYDYSKAMRKFQELMEYYPESDYIPEARLFLAKTNVGLGNYEDAERRFREITLDDRIDEQIREEAAYELAGLYYEKENYELASEEYRIVVDEANDKLIKAMSLYRLGECLVNMQQYEEAPSIFKRAVEASPNEDFKSQAKYKLGEAQSLVEDYGAAIKTFEDLLSKEMNIKRVPMIKLQLADNLRYKGELVEAVKWYNNIIEEHERTDASARSYFALAEIEEFINQDYKKAEEYYKLVRGEFANSLIAPVAQERADDIEALFELSNEIARLEGREVEEDSTTAEKENEDNRKPEKDDAHIDLLPDGMWVNYTGRDRPPPKTLTILTDADRERMAQMQMKRSKTVAEGDSTTLKTETKAVVLDSAALAKQKEQEEKKKSIQLAEKKLALAELLLFKFEKPDSAISLYLNVIDATQDSILAPRALFSLGYTFDAIIKNRTVADSIFYRLLELYPNSRHADGARKVLGIKKESKIDSAKIYFKMAEDFYLNSKNYDKAIDLYQSVVEKYPESEYAKKAKYAIGLMYEKEFYDYENAFSNYKEIAEMWPKSSIAATLKPKIAAFETEQKKIKAKEKAKADSLAKLASAGQDSVSQVTGDSLLANAKSMSQSSTVPDSNQIGTLKQQVNMGADSLINRGMNSPSGSVTAIQKSTNDTTAADSETKEPELNQSLGKNLPPNPVEEKENKATPELKEIPAMRDSLIPTPENE